MTSNLPVEMLLSMISYLSSLVAISLTTLQQGSHFLNSFYQLPSVILGAIMICGPLIFLNYFMKEIIEMVWIVLPRPMSSAKIPLMPLSYKEIIQFRPTS